MKRSIFIVCLLILSLVARGVEHHFNDAAGTTLTWKNSDYTIGYMSDGTIYTCRGGAYVKFVNKAEAGGICIDMKAYGDSVIISPAKRGLQEMNIYHYPSSAVTMQVAVSTDSISWSPVSSTQKTGYVEVTGLNGNYFVKLKRTGGSEFYITGITYTLSDPCPNCHPVVAP